MFGFAVTLYQPCFNKAENTQLAYGGDVRCILSIVRLLIGSVDHFSFLHQILQTT